ncbi:MAG: hypothetical protein OEM39_05910 [Acidimicrobiia bacterium]|nr:hypothetical protein [Acidimicrobiia bacterium]MDH3463989.1 hypothetical protein [Acidimicrobiia bacterium]
MDEAAATQILADATESVNSGRGLAHTGFWKLVAQIKRQNDLDPLIDQVAELDQRAFQQWAFFTVPLWLGTTVMVLGTMVGVLVVGLAYSAEGFVSGVWLVVGTGVLLVTTHGLAHLVVGAVGGIRFSSWFIGTIKMPQPGVKTDYSTYLRASPSSRAWMHASGAIATKSVPFLMLGAGVAADVPAWALIALVAIGVVTIVTDVLWSTSASDWKKFRREKAFAQDS